MGHAIPYRPVCTVPVYHSVPHMYMIGLSEGKKRHNMHCSMQMGEITLSSLIPIWIALATNPDPEHHHNISHQLCIWSDRHQFKGYLIEGHQILLLFSSPLTASSVQDPLMTLAIVFTWSQQTNNNIALTTNCFNPGGQTRTLSWAHTFWNHTELIKCYCLI